MHPYYRDLLKNNRAALVHTVCMRVSVDEFTCVEYVRAWVDS